ncbi:hypothetical protein DZF91_22190 [Actinomadura logoneensis]|uniref:Uncharacterized protein n=1 Tax=Actinomadura logoneensis TaxID=2293572 RepID=A0A372JHU2_9ACTN|nr:hypothetical protein [Actinomadura logoneensis]RFU39469.1 hypothetical protein DZF91_22190 [Actinomadura logoneensis]
MSKYHLTPGQLAQIDHVYTVGYGEYAQAKEQKGLTQQEFDALPEYQQREYFYKYGPGMHAGHPGDADHKLPKQEPDRNWKAEAHPGYKVDPEELRAIARDMGYKLEAWRHQLTAVTRINVTPEHLGNIKGSGDFTTLVEQSKNNYGAFINDIVTAYKGVITKLNAAADAYEQAHDTTKKQVAKVDTSGTPNLT